MTLIRNRNFRRDACPPLPWGDPYILGLIQEFVLAERSQSAYEARHMRVHGEAYPPLSDPTPEFDLPFRGITELPGEEQYDDE